MEPVVASGRTRMSSTAGLQGSVVLLTSGKPAVKEPALEAHGADNT